MKKLTSLSIYCLLLVFFSLTVVSCKEDAPTPPAEQKAEATTEVAAETSTETPAEIPVETPNVKFLNDEKFAGEKNVTVTVYFPGDDYAPEAGDFVSDFEKVYKGKTRIVFNQEKSTDDKMVFSMTENAMGLKELMYEVFKNKTFRSSELYGNDEATPPSGLLMKKAGLKLEDVLAGKDNETFDVGLNEIIFEGDKAPQFVFDAKGAYDADIKAVPLVCNYSAWNRILDLKQKGDKEIHDYENPTEEGEEKKSIEKVGFTLNPNFYFNATTIEKDEHKEKVDYYTVAKASYDKEKKELTFEFSMDYSDLGNYIKVKAVYSL